MIIISGGGGGGGGGWSRVGRAMFAPIDKTELELPDSPTSCWPDLPGHFLYQEITSSASQPTLGHCGSPQPAHTATDTQHSQLSTGPAGLSYSLTD